MFAGTGSKVTSTFLENVSLIFYIGSRKKDSDKNDDPSLADGSTLGVEKRETEIRPQSFPQFLPVEPWRFPRELAKSSLTR